MRVWLKHHYQDAMSGPENKRMKLSDILEEAKSALKPLISSCVLSRAIKAEYLVKKKKNRKKIFTGWRHPSSLASLPSHYRQSW